ATQMDASSQKSVNEAFRAFDTDGDGHLSREELRQGLLQFGASPERVDEVVNELDVGKTGQVSYTEFLAGIINLRGKQPEEQDRLLAIAWEQFRPDASGTDRNKGFVELEGEEMSPWDILTKMNEDWWQTAIYERRCGSDKLLGTSIKQIDPEKACDGYPPDTPDPRAEPTLRQSRRSGDADVYEVETAGCSAYCTGCKGCKGPEWTNAAAETTSRQSSNTRTSNTSRTRPTAAPKTRPIPTQEANKKDSSKVVPVPTIQVGTT
ncbi:unnamed protein product, partial [Polarella glacialis]